MEQKQFWWSILTFETYQIGKCTLEMNAQIIETPSKTISFQCEEVVHKSKKICTLHVKKEKCCPAITNYWQNEVVTFVVMLLATYKIRVAMIMKFQEIGMKYIIIQIAML